MDDPRFTSTLLFKPGIHNATHTLLPSSGTLPNLPESSSMRYPPASAPCLPHLIHRPMVRFSLQTHPHLTTTTSYGLFLFLPPGALSEPLSTPAQCAILSPALAAPASHSPTDIWPISPCLSPPTAFQPPQPERAPRLWTLSTPSSFASVDGPRLSILLCANPGCLSVTDSIAVLFPPESWDTPWSLTPPSTPVLCPGPLCFKTGLASREPGQGIQEREEGPCSGLGLVCSH